LGVGGEDAWGYISEFPYETKSDAANAFGLLLTVVIRSLVTLVPMCIIEANVSFLAKD
jgi:hypothetical protein